MSKPTILALFNTSDYVHTPWLNDRRFNCVSVDWTETDHSGAHRTPTEGHTILNIDLSRPLAVKAVRDSLDALNMAQPSLVISFAPCTDMAVSGAAHFAKKRAQDPMFQHKAVAMATLATRFDCPYAVENPVSVLATMWRKPDLYWNPADFGHCCPLGAHPIAPEIYPAQDAYNKKTCLWVGNGFQLPQPAPVPVAMKQNPGHVKLGGKSAKTKYLRSLTPRGFAQAVYNANVEVVLRSV